MLLFESIQLVASLPGIRNLIAVRRQDRAEIIAVVIAFRVGESLAVAFVDADFGGSARASFGLFGRVMNLDGFALELFAPPSRPAACAADLVCWPFEMLLGEKLGS